MGSWGGKFMGQWIVLVSRACDGFMWRKRHGRTLVYPFPATESPRGGMWCLVCCPLAAHSVTTGCLAINSPASTIVTVGYCTPGRAGRGENGACGKDGAIPLGHGSLWWGIYDFGIASSETGALWGQLTIEGGGGGHTGVVITRYSIGHFGDSITYLHRHVTRQLGWSESALHQSLMLRRSYSTWNSSNVLAWCSREWNPGFPYPKLTP